MVINDRTISEILKYSLIIPENQRKYEWDNVNADDFYNDLLEDESTNTETFYLGSILLLKHPSQNKIKTFQIIDGQQRITTIYIFLIVIRQLAKKYASENAILNIHSMINPRKTVFTPSPSIAKTFNHIKEASWNGDFPPLEDKRIKERIKPVYTHFFDLVEQQFKNKGKDSPADFFEDLIKQVEDIQVGELIIESDIEAFTLFERLNARGTMLSITDLLKNHIFKKKDKDLQDIWTKIDEDFTSKKLPILTMVRYFYMSQNGFIRKKYLYRELKSLANKEPKEFMAKLEHFSDFYVAFTTLGHTSFDNLKTIIQQHFKIKIPDNNRFFSIFKSLYGLNRYGLSQPIPLIYNFLKKYSELGLVDESSYRKLLTEFCENLERYHFISNFICKERANKVEEFYGNKAGEFNQVDSASSFESLIKKFYLELPSIPSYPTFEEKFLELDYKNNNKDIKEIFSRINMADQKGECLPAPEAVVFMLDPGMTKDSWNTEHWFPQNPVDKSLIGRLKDQEIIHNIGNLFLITERLNNKLDNLSPVDKANKIKKENDYVSLANGHLKSFVDEYENLHDIWNDEHILDRAKKLANICYNVYWKFAPKLRAQGGDSLVK